MKHECPTWVHYVSCCLGCLLTLAIWFFVILISAWENFNNFTNCFCLQLQVESLKLIYFFTSLGMWYMIFDIYVCTYKKKLKSHRANVLDAKKYLIIILSLISTFFLFVDFVSSSFSLILLLCCLSNYISVPGVRFA